MNRNTKFNGERLKNARQYRGWTLTDLAAKTGLKKQSLSLYENGTTPDLEKILALSRELNFPYTYFFVDNTFKIKTEATYFRSLLSANKKDRIAQSIKLEFIAQIYEVLCEYIEFPILDLPNIEFDGGNDDYAYENANEVSELENISMEVRNHWNLGIAPIKNMNYLLESHGILIMSFDPNTEKIDAFSQRTIINNEEVFFVAISKTGQSITRARFDLAHELGHILLHPWSEDLESITKEEFKARERQANIFASSFLLPKESFKTDVAHYPTNLEYYKFLKTKWNVSIQAMIYRAHQLEIISSNQYQYLMRQISKNGWREKEPDDKPYILTDNLLQKAISLLIDENELTSTGLIECLRSQGIFMHESELESLLSLKPGILEPKTPKQEALIQLKNLDDIIEIGDDL